MIITRPTALPDSQDMSDMSKTSKINPSWSCDWDNLLKSMAGLPLDAGINCHRDFVKTLNKVLVPADANPIYWSLENGGIRALLPTYIRRVSAHFFHWLELNTTADLYPGRGGIIAEDNNGHGAQELMSQILKCGDWHKFSINCVADSKSEKSLLQAAMRCSIEPYVTSVRVCPYISLPENWDDLYNRLSKSFRYNIRNGEKKLNAEGELGFTRIYRSDQVDLFLEQLSQIERSSWKEIAKTSLTKNPLQETFHSKLAPIAAENRMLRSYVLTLNGSPIAHIYGLLRDRIFYCLKLSFSEAFRKYSPGIVITALAMKDLITSSTLFWDFVGPVEDYKMRWTSDTYTLRSYIFFNSGVKGRLLYGRHLVRKFLRERQRFEK